MVNPVEGVDYIIDKYAIFKLLPDATDEQIKEAIKQAKIENHPDILVRASDKIKAEAERARELIAKCEPDLTDPEKKAKYDERLKWFQQNEPKLISKDGHEIVSASRNYVDLDMLIRGDTPDQSLEHGLIDKIAAGGSARSVKMMERAYLANPSDQEAKAAYHEALAMRLVALSEQERLAWEAAGIGRSAKTDNPLLDAGYYKATVDQNIENVRSHIIPDVVEQRSNALLAGAGTPLLLPAPQNDGQHQAVARGLTDDEKAAIILSAGETFAERTHRLTQLSDEKQSLLLKILDLSEVQDITPGIKGTDHTQIFLMFRPTENAEPTVVFGQRINNKTLQSQIIDGWDDKTLSDLKKAGFKDESHIVEIDPELAAHGYGFTHITHAYKKVRGLPQEPSQSQATGK